MLLPEPVEEQIEEPVVEEPVAEEVKSSNNDLEERVKVLEERLDATTNILKRLFPSKSHFGNI